MPNAVDPSSHQDEPARREDFSRTAFFLEQDFRRAVGTLTWMIRTAEKSDKELIERIVRTKAVAERGLRLSKLLSSVTRKHL